MAGGRIEAYTQKIVDRAGRPDSISAGDLSIMRAEVRRWGRWRHPREHSRQLGETTKATWSPPRRPRQCVFGRVCLGGFVSRGMDSRALSLAANAPGVWSSSANASRRAYTRSTV